MVEIRAPHHFTSNTVDIRFPGARSCSDTNKLHLMTEYYVGGDERTLRHYEFLML
jgi:hypothetical protein